MGVRQVARLTGLSPARVQRIRNSQVERIRTSTARTILDCAPIPAAGSLRCPARAQQLVKWFKAEGFTLVELAIRLGLDARTLACRAASIEAGTEARLSAYRRALAQ